MRFFALLLVFAGLAPAAPATVTTILGTGAPGFSETQVNNPYGLEIGPDGGLYFCDLDNQRIRRFDLKTRHVTNIAGNGQRGYTGDGGPALDAALNMPHELRFDAKGDIYIAERDNHVIRRVDMKTHLIATVAGTGTAGYGGDGGPGVKAQLRQPHSIFFAGDDILLICDLGNQKIRSLNTATGVIEAYDLTGEELKGPRTLSAAPDGDLFLALREGNSILRIDTKSHTARRIAKDAKLAGPKGLAWDPAGILYVADTESHAIRAIDLRTEAISPVLEGLKRPHGVYFSEGTLYLTDSENHKMLTLR